MAEDWDGFALRMAEAGHEVRAIDLWEFVEDGGCSFEDFAAALCGRVAGEDEAPVLLGYSLGGRLALHTLLAAPELWRGAVIVSAHPGLQTGRERVLRMAKDAQWAACALTGDWGAFLADWNTQGVLRGSGEEGLGDRGLLEARRKAVARGFLEWSLGKQADLRGRLGEIACPLLWITGGEDHKFTALAEEATAQQPAMRHAVVAGCGHRVPWEDTGRIVELVRSFLGRL